MFTWKIKLMTLAIGLMASLVVAHFTGFGAKAALLTSYLAGRMNNTSADTAVTTAAPARSTAGLMVPLPALMKPAAGCGASFTQPVGSPVGAGTNPESVAVGDFNLDGKPDLVVANGNSNNVTILLGNGSGGFTQPAGSPVGTGNHPVSVAVGDFNLDGKPDFAVVNVGSFNVAILLGNGIGGFMQAAGSPVSVGTDPESLAVVDFNLDGKPDLAVVNRGSNNVTILLGNGSGGFTQAAGSPVGVGAEPSFVAAGDFNLDGKPDLAVVNTFSFNVTILLGNGSGGFTAGSGIAVESFPDCVAVGDFNLDGKPDLAVSNLSSSNVTILLGDGMGGFAQAAGSPVGVGSHPLFVAMGDFNFDSKPDLALLYAASNNVTILLGNGSGGFTQAAGSPGDAGNGPQSLAVGDFNLDGKLDFAVANLNSNNVTIHLNTCDAQPCSGTAFSQPAGSPVEVGATPISVAVGDFNLDGKPDFAVVRLGSDKVNILLGNGSGGFTPAAGSPVGAGSGTQFVAVGDFNLDGKPDLAVVVGPGDVIILLGDGSGGFTQAAGSQVSAGSIAASLAVGDFNQDGKADLAVVNKGSNNVTILLGNGSGGFMQAAGSPIGAGLTPDSVVTMDFNHDGKLDLAVANGTSNNVTILLGNGSGGFTQAAGSPASVGSGPQDMLVGDFNLDGKPDLAVGNGASNNVTILLGNGSGGFTQSAGSPVGAGSFPVSVAMGDFDLDGKPDLAVANRESSKVTILLNTCTSNTPPTIITMPVTRTADGSSVNSQIATVGDVQDARSTLSVKVNGGASATVNGVTVSNLTVDAAGVVKADVVAGANATSASFTLRVTDSGGLFAEATLNVTVVGFSVKLTDPAVCLGQGGVVGVTAQVTNPNAAQVTASFTATPDPNLLALPGTCVVNVGTCSVDAINNKVNWNGALNAGQTVTISYQAQVSDAAPNGAELCVTSTASFNVGPLASVTACTTLNCPTIGPGALPLAASPVSDQKAGSVLVYNLYTSGVTDSNAQNTRIAITNTHPGLSAPVHLFFVDGSSCSVADSYICLTPNQTTTFLASDIDPGTTGYVVAIAVDRDGCPRNFNYLIGDEYVKLTSGHAANLGAEAFSALAGGLPLCDANTSTAVLNFDGISYNRVPRVLAVDNIPSGVDGNDTQLILNRFGGNLATGAETLGTIFGILYNDTENAQSFSVSGSCQLRGSLSNNFPRIAPRFENFIPAGRSGWMKLYSQNDIGILGAVINFNPNAGTQANAFNQGHNLHKLTLSATNSLTIPVFPPGC
jgi:hypothetical protein